MSWKILIKEKIEGYILFQIFYRFFEVNDIANTGHDS